MFRLASFAHMSEVLSNVQKVTPTLAKQVSTKRMVCQFQMPINSIVAIDGINPSSRVGVRASPFDTRTKSPSTQDLCIAYILPFEDFRRGHVLILLQIDPTTIPSRVMTNHSILLHLHDILQRIEDQKASEVSFFKSGTLSLASQWQFGLVVGPVCFWLIRSPDGIL